MSDARKIRIGMVLALIQFCMLAITLGFHAGMDAQFVRTHGCTPADMAREVR